MGWYAKGDCRLAHRVRHLAWWGVPFDFRDVPTDAPALVELDSAGARRTMTRATDIEQQASAWLIRSESGNFSEHMRVALGRWLQDPRNRVIFLRIKEAWRRAGRIRSARPFDGNVDADLLKDTNLTFGPKSIKGGSRWTARIAAVTGFTAVVYLGFLMWTVSSQADWMSYTTSIGGYEHITLGDGSGIQLNTDSEVRARLTLASREVQLIRGEALVNVTHDLRRPFTVSAAGTFVRADPPVGSGTAFVVYLRALKSVEVAVIEGHAILAPSDRIIDVVSGRTFFAQSTLTAGEAAAVRSRGVHLMKVGIEELNRKLSWTAGLLSFQGETLSEVADEFNRYNRKHLVVIDPSIADRRIGGAFQATDPDSFVSALQKRFGIHAEEQRPKDSESSVIRLSRADY